MAGWKAENCFPGISTTVCVRMWPCSMCFFIILCVMYVKYSLNTSNTCMYNTSILKQYIKRGNYFLVASSSFLQMLAVKCQCSCKD